MNELELKKKRIDAIVKIAAMGILGFFVAPVIFLTIKGIVGLIITAALSFTAINMIPWFSLKVQNWKLKALMSEAAQNPILTLQNQYREREQGLVEFREQIKIFHAEVQNFYTELEEHRQKYPGKTQKFEDQYVKMTSLLNMRGQKYKLAQQKLKEFAEIIQQKESEFKIAQAAARMSKASGVGEQFINKLLTDTAIDTVQTDLNTAFAELSVSILDEQLAADNVQPTQVIENKTNNAIPEKTGPPTLDLDFISDNNVKVA